jgi:hypothetical protein
LKPSSFKSVEPVRRKSWTVKASSGVPSFCACSYRAVVTRLKAARDIGASASQREGRGDAAADIIELAKPYGRYGYRRITALLRHAGWAVMRR